MNLDQVFDDRSGFTEYQRPVLDDGGGAHRVQRLIFRRRHPVVLASVVSFQLVFEPELLAEPDDSFRLGMPEVMHGQRMVGHGSMCG